MDNINVELLNRLRGAIDHHMDLSAHYSGRIVAQTETVRQRAIAEGLRRRDLEAVRIRGRSRTTNAEEGERFDFEHSMRQFARDAGEAGHSAHHVDSAVAAFARQAAAADVGSYEAALQSATAAREAAEAELHSLEAKRGEHGRLAGWSRETIKEAEDFLANRLMPTTRPAMWIDTPDIDPAMAKKVVRLLEEIEQTRQAKPPIEQEIEVVLQRVDAIAAYAAASPPMSWLSDDFKFNTTTFQNSLLAMALTLGDPVKIREMVVNDTRRRAQAWEGGRMPTIEKERKLTTLEHDLRVARVRLEVHRRELEEQTGDTWPRLLPIDHPSIWLLVPDTLNALVETANGRSK